MKRPTPALESIKGAVKAAQHVHAVAFAIVLNDEVRLALTTDEVAELLGWKPEWVREAIREGAIRSRYTGRRHAVPVSAILEYLGEKEIA